MRDTDTHLPPDASPLIVTVFAMHAPVGADTVGSLQDQVIGAMRGGREAFVIDLGAVDGITTNVLSLLCAEMRQLQHQGAVLAIADPDPLLVSVLRLCRLHGLGLHPSVRLAVAALQGKYPARSPGPPLVHRITVPQPDIVPNLAATLDVTDPVRDAHAGVGDVAAARRGTVPSVRRAGTPFA